MATTCEDDLSLEVPLVQVYTHRGWIPNNHLLTAPTFIKAKSSSKQFEGAEAIDTPSFDYFELPPKLLQMIVVHIDPITA